MIIPYNEARDHINEADVLLFRAPPFPSIGWGITKYTGGVYSHVGLAHWDKKNLYCVEQREFKGGRSVVLSHQVKLNPNRIDVFRAKPKIMIPSVDNINGKMKVSWKTKSFDYETRYSILDSALALTGSSYGWKNIWKIFKAYAPFFRLVTSKDIDDCKRSEVHVCSTLVNYCYRIHYIDPCPNLSDDRTTPDDIGRSALFDYLFTIGE